MGVGARSKTSRAKLRRAEDIKRACELRMQDMTVRQIASVMGCSHGRVHNLLRDATVEIPREAAEELLQIRVRELEREVERLRRVAAAFEKKAVAGDVGAADIVVKASGKRIDAIEKTSKIEGSAAASRAELTGGDGGPLRFDLTGLTDEQIDRLAGGDASPLAAFAKSGENGKDPEEDGG